MRRAARIDAPQPDIVRALRRCGYVVHITSTAGEGYPDLTVGCPWGEIVLIEIKDGDKPPSAQKLTPDQVEFHQRWHRFPVLTVISVRDCFEQLERRRKERER